MIDEQADTDSQKHVLFRVTVYHEGKEHHTHHLFTSPPWDPISFVAHRTHLGTPNLDPTPAAIFTQGQYDGG